MSPQARLILSILAVLSVFFVGTAGYMVIEQDHQPTFGEAAYMTVLTLSTVGFTEVWELSPTGRLWTIVVIAFGIVTVSYAITSLIALFVSGELRFQRERKKMNAKIQNMSGHVILCGYGRMGALIVAELEQRGMKHVVIEHDRGLEETLSASDVPFLIGDATEEETLLLAGLMKAGALVAALRHDADNVFITLTARTLNPNLRIVARAEQPATVPKLQRAGASRAVCPQIIGASRVVDVLTRPNVVDFVEMASKGVELEMDEYILADQSPLAGRTLRDSLVREKSGGSVVAIKRADGETLFNPNPDAVLAVGDTLILVGPAGISARLEAILD